MRIADFLYELATYEQNHMGGGDALARCTHEISSHQTIVRAFLLLILLLDLVPLKEEVIRPRIPVKSVTSFRS